MTDKVQKIREEVERLMNELIQEKEKGFDSDIDDACILELQNVLTFIDSLQEEPISEQNLSSVERIGKDWKEDPISEDLEEACEQLSEDARKHKAETSSPFFSQTDYKQGVMDGAKWQKEKMMAKAIDAHCFGFQDAALFSFRLPVGNYLVGSEVKVIVIKED